MVELGIRPQEWSKVSEENKTSLTLASDPPADWHLRKKTIIAWRAHVMPYCAAFAIYAQEALGQCLTTTVGQTSRQKIYSTISLLTKNYTMLTDTNTSVNFTALSLSGMHSDTTSAHQENQVDTPSR